MKYPESKSILFFDGDCSLCNRTVRFLIHRDRHKRLYFAPLHGIAAKAIVPSEYRKSLDTIVYNRAHLDKKHSLHIRSDAVLLALFDIGGIWGFIGRCGRLLPIRLRDWCYDHIARNRANSILKKASCELPSADEQARILP